MVKQRHARYTAEMVAVSGDAAKRTLVGDSIVAGSKRNYKSRMRTLERFLRKQRQVDGECDPQSCTEDEFVQFLLSWKEGGHGDPESFRSALLYYHRLSGVEYSFCEKRAIVKAVKGATTKVGSVDKGVLVQKQIDEVVYDLDNGKLGDFGCKSCKGKWTENDVLESIGVGVELLAGAFLRPGTQRRTTSSSSTALGVGCLGRLLRSCGTGSVSAGCLGRLLRSCGTQRGPARSA